MIYRTPYETIVKKKGTYKPPIDNIINRWEVYLFIVIKASARAATHTPSMENIKITFKIPKLSIKCTFEQINIIAIQYAMFIILPKRRIETQATSNRVPCEAHGTYPLNPMGHNVIDGKFVCPMIEGNHHGTNQSEMHQT